MKRPRGRPKTEVETGVIAVRLPKAQIESLDHYVNLLESRGGRKVNRSAVARQALELHLQACLKQPLSAAVTTDGAHGTAWDQRRHPLWQRLQEAYRKSQELGTYSQELRRGNQQLRTELHDLRTHSRQLRGTTQSLRERRLKASHATTQVGRKI